MNVTCEKCGREHRVRVFPLYCRCGAVHYADSSTPASPRTRKSPPTHHRTFGTALQELVGCGCNLPCRKWDRRGLDWCRDNANRIAKRLTREPKPGLSAEQAAEMVQLAIEIAEKHPK